VASVMNEPSQPHPEAAESRAHAGLPTKDVLLLRRGSLHD